MARRSASPSVDGPEVEQRHRHVAEVDHAGAVKVAGADGAGPEVDHDQRDVAVVDDAAEVDVALGLLAGVEAAVGVGV